jgi:hypothetical protein
MKSFGYFICSIFAFILLTIAANAQEGFPSYRCKVKSGYHKNGTITLFQSNDPAIYGYNIPIGTTGFQIPGYDRAEIFLKAGFDSVLTYGRGLKLAHPTNDKIFGVLIYNTSAGPKRFSAEFILVEDKVILASKLRCRRFKK